MAGEEDPGLTATTFHLAKMDCPSEERLVRMAVDGRPAVQSLRFDLADRTVAIVHRGQPSEVLAVLEPLKLGATIKATRAADSAREEIADPAGERKVLRQLLAINAAMFAGELVLGFVANSAGLIADSLDMFADAMVYGLSLLAVGRSGSTQRRAAALSGWLQALLAVGVLSEVVRRFVSRPEPVEELMIGVALVALVANLACVALLARHRRGGVHLRASWIFTTNDALANVGVIVAGLLVMATSSAVPDLVIGTVIAAVVLGGAVRILRLARADSPAGADG